ncbi:MAG: hypothetical protein BWY80_00235 [Firmicutes bacterium ADurb.Bin456]|nr:MAG: hypothetical protein BWY80_00235 [Firmicutes bacterium ADurb.Bin456]
MTDKDQNGTEKTDITPINEGTGPLSVSEPGKKLGRSQLLDLSTVVLGDIMGRLTGDRFRERDGDRTKLGYLRALTAQMSCHASILKDQDLEQINRKLDLLLEVKQK